MILEPRGSQWLGYRAAYALVGDDIFRQQTERPVIIIALRRKSPMLAIGNDHSVAGRIVRKKLLLPIRVITRQRATGGRGQTGNVRALHFLIAASQTKTESLQRPDRGVFERLEKNAPFERSIILEIEVARIARVADAIKNPGSVADGPIEEIPMQLQAQIATGH